uniref:inorganic diphosphatase n=1 Tax=Mucochytrium quahogii TaxID=96639 RepID=A0A7S2W3K1_9STRA|mmetsp:Transcript_34334/g.54969  ORF Transcript_34334/g.54969 Transcript_34334/m.54969 type:complete len:275 (+) Transcript_34334:139-963(+)
MQRFARRGAELASRGGNVGVCNGIVGARSITSVFPEVTGNQVHGFPLRNDKDYRVFFERGGIRVSPWHDINLFYNKEDRVVNYVNEIPRGSTDKMEIATDEEFNPIKQDIKKGELRRYPFESLTNYGALPQTWESPDIKDEETGYFGDNDPLDFMDVGAQIRATGEVYQVKVIGCMGMIDQGEMDWKIIGIATDDPLAASINTVADMEQVLPEHLNIIMNWLKYYKVPDGKEENSFSFNNNVMDANFAMKVLEETHLQWQDTAAIKQQGFWKKE